MTDASNESREATDHLPLRGTSIQYREPRPHPQLLAEYERVTPGVGEKIIEAFIAEADHRRKGERFERRLSETLTHSQIANARLGLWLAFAAVVIFASVALVAILRGHPWAGVTILGVDLLGLVTVFIGAESSSAGARTRVRTTRWVAGSQRQTRAKRHSVSGSEARVCGPAPATGGKLNSNMFAARSDGSSCGPA